MRRLRYPARFALIITLRSLQNWGAVKRKSTIKKLLSATLVGALSVTALIAPAAQASTPVNIPDANLRDAIIDELGLAPDTVLTKDHLAGLDYLKADDVANLQGLEHAVNLVDLNIYKGSVSDLTPLKNLTKLEFADLGGNNIADISPLAGLVNLDTLYLDANKIRDITPLKKLTKLSDVYLRGQSVELPDMPLDTKEPHGIKTIDGSSPALTIDEGAGTVSGANITWTELGIGGLTWEVNVTVGSNSVFFSGYATTTVKPQSEFFRFTQIVPSPDLNGDKYGDVLAVDKSGNLWLYPGKAGGALGTATKIGTGSGNLTISAPGDFNGDGKADILAKAKNGDLYFYPGNGKGGLGKSSKAGWGWGPYDIIPAGDVTGDGIADVLAIDAKGVLYYYAGNGKGGFTGKLTKNGQGWTNVDLYPAGDLNGDKKADILSIRADGTLHTHLGKGNGGFSKSTQSGRGWAGYELFAGSDANADGLADLYSRNLNGELFYYAGKAGGFRAAVKLGSGW